jgi:hypothetical protein
VTSLDEIAATIENLPAVLGALLAPIDPAVLATPPEPGEWSVHQVVGHLITGDGPAFRDRIADIVGGCPEIVPFDPGPPVESRDFDSEALDGLLAELTAERRASAAYLRTLTTDDLAAISVDGRHGSLAAGDFAHEWPFHDHDHLQQILAILKTAHLPAMTAQMQRALTSD